jgi:hypothetical protein
MDRQDIAYLVNSTPKYYYLLPLHFALLRRYGAACKWPVYIASEVPTDGTLLKCKEEFSLNILPLEDKDKYFLESRLAAVKALPPSIKYIFPIQEDFLLQARPDEAAIEEALNILDTDASVTSIRLMPCPGPRNEAKCYKSSVYRFLGEHFMFSYQATIWRREQYCLYFASLLEFPENVMSTRMPEGLTPDQQKKWFQVDFNIAENKFGQQKFKELLGNSTLLAYPRAHIKPNAVYLCPWPYRPTAVEKGKVGEWVYEFAEREGYPLLG